jgi:hypothetical protein
MRTACFTAGLLLLGAAHGQSRALSLPGIEEFVADFGKQPQERDYSARTLFHEAHAKFVNGMDRYRPDLRASFGQIIDGNVKSETGDFDVDEWYAEGRLHWYTDPDSYVIYGPQFRSRDYNFSPTSVGAEDETLYIGGVHLGYGTFINDDVLLELVFSPAIYSDFDGTLKSEDYKFYGDGLLTFRSTDTLFFKAGVYYSGDVKDAPVLPLGGLAWQFMEQFRFDMLLPKYAEVSWTPGTSTLVHIGLDLDGEEYRVRSSLGTGKVPYDVHTQEITARLGVIQRLTDSISLWGDVGYIVAGDYKWRDAAANRYDGTMEPTFTWAIGFGIDF